MCEGPENTTGGTAAPPSVNARAANPARKAAGPPCERGIIRGEPEKEVLIGTGAEGARDSDLAGAAAALKRAAQRARELAARTETPLVTYAHGHVRKRMVALHSGNGDCP